MGQHRIKELHFVATSEQASTKFGEDRKVKARITQFEGKGILPINALLNGFSSLSIRQALDELEDANQSEPPWGFCWLTTCGKQGGKGLVLINDAQLIPDLHVQGSFGIDCPSKTSGFFGNGIWFWKW